jgi:hypothetical protein
MLQKMDALMGVCQAGGPTTLSPVLQRPACADETESLRPGDGIPPPPGAFIPDCDMYGHYQPKQCHGSSGHCWCVDIISGTEILGTRRGPTEPQFNCHQVYTSRPVTSTTIGPAISIPSLFTDVTDDTYDTDATVPLCSEISEGARNCRKIATNQDAVALLQRAEVNGKYETTGDSPIQVKLLPDLDVTLTLRRNVDNDTYMFTTEKTGEFNGEIEAMISIDPYHGNLYGKVFTSGAQYLLRHVSVTNIWPCGNKCNIFAEKDGIGPLEDFHCNIYRGCSFNRIH